MAVTEGLSFEYPRLLFGFFAFIPLALFEVLFFRRRFARSAGRNRLTGSSGDLPLPLLRRVLLSRVCFMLFLACLTAALAGPRWGRAWSQGEYRRGLDVVIAVDVSRSMEIRDSAGFGNSQGEYSRLERGLAVACEMVKALPGVRFAAAVSRGRGLVTVPLTWDSDAVLSFLEALDGSSLTGRGTNLESLVDAASGAFQPSSPAQKAIVLISDGEALSGSIKAAVDRSAGEDIIVNALAVGSDEGGPVPEGKLPPPGVWGQASGESGQEEQIISRRDSAVMRMAAERSGGIYIDGNRKDAPALLAEYLRSRAPESETRGMRREKKRQWPLFVIAALLFYGASKLCLLCPLSFLRCPALIVFLFLLSSCSGISGKLFIIEANFFNSQGLYSRAAASYMKALAYEEAEAYAEYGLGSAYYSLDEAAAALARFEDSRKILEGRSPAEHRELRYRLSYNTGVVFFGEGNFLDAAQSFKEALKIDPGRIEAKRNLELSLLSLARSRSSGEQAEPEKNEPENSAVLFEYLRRKEQNQWRSREWAVEEEDSGPDY
jgi:Ca-activated chloride channel family protein